MKPIVGIIDYEMGNLRSVEKAIARCGGEPIVSGDPSAFSTATHLILPGVGAFRDAMFELQRRDLVPFIHAWASSGKPLLGICLGLQLFFERSYEGGVWEGLGLLRGEVVRFQWDEASQQADLSPPGSARWSEQAAGGACAPAVASALKVPHMGWNQVTSSRESDPLLAGMPASPYFYFVHSYYAVPSDPNDVWLTSHYGHSFCAAVQRGNLVATQFHPEKSQANGMRLLANFLGTN